MRLTRPLRCFTFLYESPVMFVLEDTGFLPLLSRYAGMVVIQ